MRASQKALIKLYLKTNTIWEVGKKLPSINTLAKLFKFSYYSTKKLINELISVGLVEKYNNKFFIISHNFDNTSDAIQERLINKAKININILKLLQKNYVYDKQTVSFIKQNGTHFSIYFPISRRKIDVDLFDIDKYPDLNVVNIIKRHKLK